ncbi:MAG: hypothetical protein GF307_03625 [candidate division Zixibacteria bacterium]|nr:hypothetical protein [candidate division Zixibacteria bacterium]
MSGVYQAEIVSNNSIDNEAYLLTLKAPEIARASMPGNFVQLKIEMADGGFWRRPFSVLDTDGGNIKILYKPLGKGTLALTKFPPGKIVSVIGALGNSFSFPSRDSMIILTGGGIGVPPLYNLAKHLIKSDYNPRNIHFFNGAAGHDSIVYLEESAELGINVYAVTEDGSMGIKGYVTDGVKQFLNGMSKTSLSNEPVMYACGPMPMLRAVGLMVSEYDVYCEMALEALMPCGFGICMGCVVMARDDKSVEGFSYKRVCREGPVFRADDIIWETDGKKWLNY